MRQRVLLDELLLEGRDAWRGLRGGEGEGERWRSGREVGRGRAVVRVLFVVIELGADSGVARKKDRAQSGRACICNGA